MEFLDQIGDWFTSVIAWVERLIRKIFGSANERTIRKIGFIRDKAGNSTVVSGSTLDRINSLEPDFEKLSEGELKETTTKLRAKLDDGHSLDDILPEAFAAVRESGKRYLQMRHYDVQMVGGCILHSGKIAEMVTGEGKTLVATLPSYLNALAGPVHVVTVNDYLALRDMEWMGPCHLGLGLTLGAIQSQMRPHERQREYAQDITYGTNNEFGFDYLRDNMKPTRELQVQGPLNYAIVDEIDNILIDEARTPLIISGPAHDDVTVYPKADRIARQLKKDDDFEIKEKERTCHLTDSGIRRAEELAGVESFYTAGNMEWPHLIDNSLRAHHLFKLDVNYVVENNEIIIIDEHTGRKMHGRQWSDGLHQAVEAKEGVKIKETTQTYATITLQNYFKLYNKLCGMTGTALTEANEFYKIYELDVVAVPTNRPMQRQNHPDVIFRSEKEKWDAVVDEVREVHDTGRPILVGTKTVEASEKLSKMLGKYGIEHSVLNAKYHEREADIVSQAGRKGGVTIATNMAGRGTDIILGGNPEHVAWEMLKEKYASRLEVPKSEWDALADDIAEKEGMKTDAKAVSGLGGLHVIGTERHDSRRIDLQLRGRAGRQGDPGSSRFFLSLEDDLMRIFAGDFVKNMLTRLGMQEGEAIESPLVTRQVEKAQKRVEERHFEGRKNLLEMDEVMDHQRKEVYSYRQRILDGANCRELIMEMIERQVRRATSHYLADAYTTETCASWANHFLGIEIDPSELRRMDQAEMVSYLKDETERQAEDRIEEQLDTNLPEDVEDEHEWSWQALSHWANEQFHTNTNENELKKLGRDQMQPFLAEQARDSIARIDFDPLDEFLADDWSLKALSRWLSIQYGLEMTPDELDMGEDAGPIKVADAILDRVRQMYHDKEVRFPVSVAMQKFMFEKRMSGQATDREGLIEWVNNRFDTQLSMNDLKEKSREEVKKMLFERSAAYYPSDDVVEQIDQLVDQVYPKTPHVSESNGNGNAHRQLIEFANDTLGGSLDESDLLTTSRDEVRQKLLQLFDERYRPELGHTERALVLQMLDTAWKEHLYYMDHLKAGIGLVSYAQKDPKVEYKREGMKAFETMWDRIGEQVTSVIFRLENESPDFVGSLWSITNTRHDQASTVTETQQAAEQERSNQPEPGQDVQAIDPIRNRQEKVGRNDPCPCGSGKKYKKCHGVT